MYKALLVDDERIVKLAVKAMIRWEELGLELAGTASNGTGALQMVERVRPDIIITDIKMPGMDGVELIKKLKEMEFDGEILVLSNYNDFELVREALRFGAYDYVLKVTVKTEDFTKLLKEMLVKLGKRKGLRGNSALSETGDGALREHYLGQVLVSGKRDFSAEAAELSRRYALGPGEVVNSFVLKAAGKDSERAPLKLAEALRSIAGELLARCGWYSAFEMDGNTALLVFLHHRDNPSFPPRNLAARLAELIETYFNIRTGLVYSEPASDYNQFFHTVRKCIRTSELFFYSRFEGSVLSTDRKVNEEEPSFESFIKTVQDKLYEDFLAARADRVLEDFKAIVDKAQERLVGPFRLKKHIKRLLRETERKLIYNGYCSEELFDEYLNDEDVIYAADTEARLLNSLENLIGTAQAHLSVNRMNYRREVREAVEYIEKHATERITLAGIARHVSLNDTYLCKVFKDDTGKSIVQYINELKMKIAYGLLSKGDMMIKEAAAAVGIDDQFYFNRLFKKIYGVTPKEVRNR